eukprot:TRINITY_DN252_c0_g1_i1.p1 TRINITY_DN252_c0_g1~~TRINITY_DN252_c0_g1_i1.p1  ORF type:complete len:184 (+),score=35.27 TRINITY_DN252_c0_g1_i1:63-614(+)
MTSSFNFKQSLRDHPSFALLLCVAMIVGLVAAACTAIGASQIVGDKQQYALSQCTVVKNSVQERSPERFVTEYEPLWSVDARDGERSCINGTIIGDAYDNEADGLKAAAAHPVGSQFVCAVVFRTEAGQPAQQCKKAALKAPDTKSDLPFFLLSVAALVSAVLVAIGVVVTLRRKAQSRVLVV